jgi:hypothetical protein
MNRNRRRRMMFKKPPLLQCSNGFCKTLKLLTQVLEQQESLDRAVTSSSAVMLLGTVGHVRLTPPVSYATPVFTIPTTTAMRFTFIERHLEGVVIVVMIEAWKVEGCCPASPNGVTTIDGIRR